MGARIGIEDLTPRERECLRLVQQLKTSKEIGRILDLAPGTIDSYLKHAAVTLNVPGRREAAAILDAYEQSTRKTQSGSTWVEPTSGTLPPEVGSAGLDWRAWLPFRTAGAKHNALSIFLRLAWPFVLAAVIACGLGMLAVAMYVLTEFYHRWIA